MDTETCALVKLLAMFPHNTNICIIDKDGGKTLHYGKVQDLTINNNKKLLAIRPNEFQIRSFNVINDFFIIHGYYNKNNVE